MQLDINDPLLKLAAAIPWKEFDEVFSIHYTKSAGANGTQIILPGKALKKNTQYQKDKKRKQCRRRAAIASTC